MDEYTDEQRERIASAVLAARLDKGWSKEEAARHAKISSITWKRVEDGLRVQVLKLRAIEIALNWGGGSMDRVARGRPVAVEDTDAIEQIRERGWADPADDVLWQGFRAANQFALDCRARGANPRLVNDFIGDTVALLNEVGRVRAHPETSALGDPVPDLGDREAVLAWLDDDGPAKVVRLRDEAARDEDLDDEDLEVDEADDPPPIRGAYELDQAARRDDKK